MSIVNSCEWGKDKSHVSFFIAFSCASSAVEGSVVWNGSGFQCPLTFRATQSSSGSLPKKKRKANGEGPRARDPFLLSQIFSSRSWKGALSRCKDDASRYATEPDHLHQQSQWKSQERRCSPHPSTLCSSSSSSSSSFRFLSPPTFLSDLVVLRVNFCLCISFSRIAAWPGPFSVSVLFLLLLLLLLHVCIAWSFALITRFRMWTALPDCLPLLFLGLGCGLHCLIVCPYYS